MGMRTVERLLIKLIIIQFICLAAFQSLGRIETSFFQPKKLLQYEGVTSGNHKKIVETYNKYIED